jgi:hypothetical protein
MNDASSSVDIIGIEASVTFSSRGITSCDDRSVEIIEVLEHDSESDTLSDSVNAISAALVVSVIATAMTPLITVTAGFEIPVQ